MSKAITSSRSSTRAATAVVSAGALFRVVSYHFSVNNGGDAGAHATLAAMWLQHPTLKFVFDVYPPGHFWLIGLTTLFVHDVVTASRVLSLVLGIASLILVWKTARLLYGELAGLLSLTVFALYSLHIAYSTTSSAEGSGVFFLLAGCYFFFRYLQADDELWCLVASGVCLSAAESIRYEPWILFGALFLILAITLQTGPIHRPWSKWLRALLVFGITGGAWPVFMMAYSWRTFGDPMYLVSANRARVTSYIATNAISRTHQLALAPSALLLSLSVLAIAGAIYGLALSISSPLPRAFTALTIFFCLFEAYQIWTGGLLATARYTLIPGTLLAIVSGLGLQKISEKMLPNRIGLAFGVIGCLLFLNLLAVLALSEFPNRFAEKLASVSPRLRYGDRVRAVGEYLHSQLGPDDSIVVDDYNVESDIIATIAGMPVIPGKRVYLLSRKNPISVEDYIESQHPRFLVYADGGTLQRSLRLARGCAGTEEIGGVRFRCTWAGEVYRVYELDYQ